MVDYFDERQKAKRENVDKNEMQRLRNIARMKGISSANSVPLGIAVDLKDRSRHEVRLSLLFALSIFIFQIQKNSRCAYFIQFHTYQF